MKVLVMKMTHECIHEEQIQGQSRKIESLETKSEYKEDAIKELKEDMKELKDSMKSLDKTINDYIIKSIQDDNTLKDYVTSVENRVTSLEASQNTMYKLLVAVPSIIAIAGVLVAYVMFIH